MNGLKDSDDDLPLDQVAEEFVTRYRRGEHPSISDFISRHPDLAEEIRELIPALVMMEDARPAPEMAAAGVTDAKGNRLERLGEFRILREIGRGGMGIVFEAEQESLGRRVALKILPRYAMLDSRQLERFQRESRSAARLHHTNIVPVYGIGEHDGLHYHVMQLIEGCSLDQILLDVVRLRKTGGDTPAAPDSVAVNREPQNADHRRPSSNEPTTPSMIHLYSHGGSHPNSDAGYWNSVARIGVQVADALAYANSQGVLHRDIKPANLMLDANGIVWVTDFGLAKASGSGDLTQTGDIVGTISYMAPERLNGESDQRSDVYSLGITLYEMLTLRHPFAKSDRQQLIRQISLDEPSAPRSLDATIPRDLETIILKAIARQPSDRYQTAELLAADLRRFLDDQPIHARRISLLERSWRLCRRNFLFGVPTDGDSADGTGMEIVGNNIVLHLVDGGRGDDDLTRNGIIFDIGGPAVSQTTAISTQTILTSDRAVGSTYGQSVHFTATVSAATGSPTGSVQFTIDGQNFGSPQPLSGGTASLNISTLSAIDHVIAAIYDSDTNGFTDSQDDFTHHVDRAPLAILADDKTKVYGAALPTLTASYTGFVNNETLAVLTTLPTLATTATVASQVGTYSIIASGAVAANYTFSYQTGTLTITSNVPTMVTTPTPTQDMTPTITWSAIPGAVSYDVWITNLSTNTVLPNQTVTGTSYTPTADLGIGRFRVWVRSQNAAGVKSRWSVPHTFAINTAVKVNPIELRQTTARPQISWQPLLGATKYEIWISSSTVSGFVLRDDTITGTSWTPSSDLAVGRYRVWVRGFSADGTRGIWSTEIVDMIVVPAPTMVSTPTSTQDMTPTITWSAIPGAVSYDVWITNLSTNTDLPIRTVTSPSYTPTTDLGIGRFRAWVRLQGPASLKSRWSTPFTFSVNTAVTLDPVVHRQNTPRPQISWQALPGATRYEVFVTSPTVSGFPFRDATITGTSWTPSSDLPIGRYLAWVRGYSADGVAAAWSREISMIADVIVVPAPSLISPLHATFDRTPTFTWSTVSGAAHYVLRVRNANTSAVVIEQTVTATNFTPTIALPDDSYNWDVRAVGPAGHQSQFSPVNRLFVGGRPVIFGPSGTAGSRTPTFSWSAVQDASRYELRVDRTDVVQNRLIDRNNLTTSSFTAPTALAAGTYRFWVRAVSVTGEFSPWSLVSNFTVVSVEDDEPLPSPNLEDAPILTALLAVRGLATKRSPESPDASPSIVSKSDQNSASDEYDKPQTHHSLVPAQEIAIVSDESQFSDPARSKVEIQESELTEYELERSLIDQVMGSSNIEWCR